MCFAVNTFIQYIYLYIKIGTPKFAGNDSMADCWKADLTIPNLQRSGFATFADGNTDTQTFADGF